MYCNAYRISQYPDAQWFYRDYVEPAVLADEAIARMTPDTDKIGFTGGEPTIHLPYIEEVVQEVQEKYAEIGGDCDQWFLHAKDALAGDRHIHIDLF